ncbi:MAG TPA: alcohol dehydrogenase catalytic domain-containing protein [Chthonomonadales bacterium]|nr:alcohol dehydrogenase catalytic domain-containing protein [Chthonomonadales bacterium]
MRAAVYRGASRIEVEDLPVPAIGPGEVLVRVGACGVCGTDLKKIRLGLAPPPRVFGHETAGTIVRTGSSVSKWRAGDRVVVNHHVPCMASGCYFCANRLYSQCPVYKRTGATAGFEPAGGGFAEYVRVMDWCVDGGLIPVPGDSTFAEAAFVEPVNTCLKAIRMTSLSENSVVLIIGLGPIGLLFTQLARLEGAEIVASDRLETRLKLSERFGAHAAQTERTAMDTVLRLSDARGADLAIVAVDSADAVAFALQATRPGGGVLLFAHTHLGDPLPVDAGEICMREKRLFGSYSSDPTLNAEAADLIFSKRLEVRPLISHNLPLERIEEGIRLASTPSDHSLKVIIEP